MISIRKKAELKARVLAISIVLVLVVSLLLAACAAPTPTPTPMRIVRLLLFPLVALTLVAGIVGCAEVPPPEEAPTFHWRFVSSDPPGDYAPDVIIPDMIKFI